MYIKRYFKFIFPLFLKRLLCNGLLTMFDSHLPPNTPPITNKLISHATPTTCWLYYQMKDGASCNTYITKRWYFKCVIYSNCFKYDARKDRYRANSINRKQLRAYWQHTTSHDSTSTGYFLLPQFKSWNIFHSKFHATMEYPCFSPFSQTSHCFLPAAVFTFWPQDVLQTNGAQRFTWR